MECLFKVEANAWQYLICQVVGLSEQAPACHLHLLQSM